MPMPLEILATFEDGSKQLYYIPVDLMFGSKKFNKNVVILDSWKWVSSEYSFFIHSCTGDSLQKCVLRPILQAVHSLSAVQKRCMFLA